MSNTLLALSLIIVLILLVALKFSAKRVPGAVARSGAITTVIHKQNAPTDLFTKRMAEKRARYKAYKYSKRHKKKLGRSNGIQTTPTVLSGDSLVPCHPF